MRPADNPLDFDENETEEVELNSLARRSARGIKTKVFVLFNFSRKYLKKFLIFYFSNIKIDERPLIIRKYKDSTTISLILFPDGSGSLFYPSGRIAVN